jgi:hypothetical protein
MLTAKATGADEAGVRVLNLEAAIAVSKRTCAIVVALTAEVLPSVQRC